MVKPSDMPTVARIRKRIDSFGKTDLSIGEVRDAFGVTTDTPILTRITRGEISGAKILGEWRIDVASIHTYLDTINKNYNRSI